MMDTKFGNVPQSLSSRFPLLQSVQHAIATLHSLVSLLGL
jgi:hypothetical protein